jgi:decaprenylphospho-beta-D-erythro-pentofuranosid-2-ulose 2-reductase
MHVLILGANSDVAQALARKFAQAERPQLTLASRDRELLEKQARDLEIRFQVAARPVDFDATDYASHAGFYGSLDPKPDVVVLAFGYLGDQKRGQEDFPEAQRIIEVNFVGAVSILEIIARDFEARGHGCIIGISSVAGERGRQSNYLYGAAKGALTLYLGGVRNRLHPRGVRVLTVLPGFVATKMTEHLDLPARLLATPEEAAEDVYRAYARGQEIVYTKGVWKWIMRVIKIIPEKVFKRLSL